MNEDAKRKIKEVADSLLSPHCTVLYQALALLDEPKPCQPQEQNCLTCMMNTICTAYDKCQKTATGNCPQAAAEIKRLEAEIGMLKMGWKPSDFDDHIKQKDAEIERLEMDLNTACEAAGAFGEEITRKDAEIDRLNKRIKRQGMMLRVLKGWKNVVREQLQQKDAEIEAFKRETKTLCERLNQRVYFCKASFSSASENDIFKIRGKK